jgi:PAS domain S-box-containing protein
MFFNGFCYACTLCCANNSGAEGKRKMSSFKKHSRNASDLPFQQESESALWHHVTLDLKARLQEQTLTSVTHALSIIAATPPEFLLLYVNQAFCTLTGYTPEEVLGQKWDVLQSSRGAEVEQLKLALETGQPCRVILESYRKDGSSFWNEIALTPLRPEEGNVTHYVVMQQDVTAQVETERRLVQVQEDLARVSLELERANAKYYHDALHDALTGLEFCPPLPRFRRL